MARSRRHGGGGAGMVSNPTASGTQVGRQYPDTTGGQGDTFLELSRNASRPGYQYALGTGFWGGTIDQPLAPAAGYWTTLDVTLFGSGGTSTATGGVSINTGTAGSDAKVHASALVSNLIVKDPANNTIVNFTDPLATYLMNVFSGQVGLMQAADPANWPSYSAISTSSASGSAGNFLGHFRIPFTFAPGGLGSISAAAANLIPTLHMAFQPSASVFTTAPSTLPSVTVEVNEQYLAAVNGAEPDDLGTTLQWTQLSASPTIGSGSSVRVNLGKVDGYVTTLILIFRDSSNIRTDYMLPGGTQSSTTSPFGNPASVGKKLNLYIDSVQVLSEDVNEVMDRMFLSYPGLTVSSNRVGPTGVIVYTFRNSITNAVLGVDDGSVWLPTSPASSIEIEGQSWGSFTNTPGSITALIGSIVPGPAGVNRGRLAGIAG